MIDKDKKLHNEEDLDKDAINRLKEMIPTITSIKLSGHSYGLEACKLIGNIIKDAPNLKVITFITNCFRSLISVTSSLEN